MLSQVIRHVSPPDRLGEPKKRFLRFRKLVVTVMTMVAVVVIAMVFFFMIVVVVVVRIGGVDEVFEGARAIENAGR